MRCGLVVRSGRCHKSCRNLGACHGSLAFVVANKKVAQAKVVSPLYRGAVEQVLWPRPTHDATRTGASLCRKVSQLWPQAILRGCFRLRDLATRASIALLPVSMSAVCCEYRAQLPDNVTRCMECEDRTTIDRLRGVSCVCALLSHNTRGQVWCSSSTPGALSSRSVRHRGARGRHSAALFGARCVRTLSRGVRGAVRHRNRSLAVRRPVRSRAPHDSPLEAHAARGAARDSLTTGRAVRRSLASAARSCSLSTGSSARSRPPVGLCALATALSSS